ncbi:hypothetical protein DUI87_10627 [Hirundo rustica rustica]|uniref:Reverse transcriptase domain-containing protein n=1 Tax=Hirundo rustica rustica TaxID=333673 RepID=A0A3M0KJ65_HIRRU|nr:hypothetical protein DUI87_10627 [Hirundo rustica rustica]
MEDIEVMPDSQHGFTEGKSCLTILVALCNGVNATVDKGKATNVIYLDSCKAFDTVPQHPSLLRPYLEYSIQLWGLQHRKETDLLERAQRKATELIRGMEHLFYEERLTEL